ncbi:unnamed protein product, partial [Ectocarpus sp. 12 AP-2014]
RQRVPYGSGREECPRTNVLYHHAPFRTSRLPIRGTFRPKCYQIFSPVDDVLSPCKVHVNSRQVDDEPIDSLRVTRTATVTSSGAKEGSRILDDFRIFAFDLSRSGFKTFFSCLWR